jgi:hypothetical protein
VDTANFLEAISKTSLPFIYFGEKLNDEKCRKAFKKIKPEGKVLAMILGGSKLLTEGLIITENGFFFSFAKGIVDIVITKRKGAFLFGEFILHSATVKKTFFSDYNIEFIFWDLRKNKSFTYEFELVAGYFEEENKSCNELLEIFQTLMSKTGTEYIEPEDRKAENDTSAQPIEDDPNTFKFLWQNLWMNYHTIIVLKDDSIIINSYKFDNKTKIQTPKGPPVTILRATIAAVKKGRAFSPVSLIGGILIGAVVGFIGFGGVFTLAIFTLLSLFFSFPKKVTIIRKDGTKYKTRFQGYEENDRNYERFINEIYKQN